MIPESFDAEPESSPTLTAAPIPPEPEPVAVLSSDSLDSDILEDVDVMASEPHEAPSPEVAEPGWDLFTEEPEASNVSSLEASPNPLPATPAQAPHPEPQLATPLASHDGVLEAMEFEDLPEAPPASPPESREVELAPAPVAVEPAKPVPSVAEASVFSTPPTSSEKEQLAQFDPRLATDDLPVSVHSDTSATAEAVVSSIEVPALPVVAAPAAQDVDADSLEFSLAGESPLSPEVPTPPAASVTEAAEPWQVAAAPKAAEVSPEPVLTAEPAAPSEEPRTELPQEFDVALVSDAETPPAAEPVLAVAPSPMEPVLAVAPAPVEPEFAAESPAVTAAEPEPASHSPALTAAEPEAPAQPSESAASAADVHEAAAIPEDTAPPKPRLVVPAPAPTRERTPIALDDLPASSEEPMQLASTWEFVGWQGGEGEGPVGHTADTTWADRVVDLDGPATSTPAANEGGVALASAWEFMQHPWQPQASEQPDTVQALLAAASASTDTPTNGPTITADQVLSALDTADSQGMVGKVLLAYSAGRFRRAFLLGDSFGLARVGRAWGPGSERPEVSALKVDLDAPSLLASALKGPSPSVFNAPQGPQDEAIFSALCESESHLLVFPLHARGQPVAFFVAENGPAPVELDTLEELGRIADRAVEICTRLHRFP
ncbi:hypothetical protein [Corallococcus sp. CA047B]|uniref:hypothetical protein n=1 Tax=Corallococcus sp. CA047B TaxID=2316729 RepID=UPI001F3232C8|nr:hypothetical protein [Corallococcus sp. CA047B]